MKITKEKINISDIENDEFETIKKSLNFYYLDLGYRIEKIAQFLKIHKKQLSDEDRNNLNKIHATYLKENLTTSKLIDNLFN